ncbi:MAG: hypothetical protein AAFR57_05320 [Pseudomonadota bacterium]
MTNWLGRSALVGLMMLGQGALADSPLVTDVVMRDLGGVWRFDVTVSHPDTGWDHYADAWAVYAPDGTELGIRELLHPHVNEQPFTRSLSGVRIPDDLDEVVVRARDSVHGWGEGVTIPIPR